MRSLIYARVSTSNHDQKPEIQIHSLREYCQARGWSVGSEIIDHGFSGGTDKRPGLRQLMSLVRARRVDVVVVTKLDRLARSLRHLVALLDEFSALGIQFVSIGDQLDMTTASGRLMLHLIGAFAEFERAMIRERTVAGLVYARSQGKTLGRPRIRDDVPILALRAEGLSYRAIAKRLAVSRGAIYRALHGVPKTSTKSPEKVQSKRGTR